MEWSMVLKAAERSRRQRQVTCWRPMGLIRKGLNDWMERSRVSVEWNFRYADWSGLRSWFRTRWSVKRDWDDTLDDFGYGEEIGDWSVVRKIFFVQRGFLEKGSDNRLFQLRGILTSKQDSGWLCEWWWGQGHRSSAWEVMLGGYRDHTVCWDDQESVWVTLSVGLKSILNRVLVWKLCFELSLTRKMKWCWICFEIQFKTVSSKAEFKTEFKTKLQF